MIHQFLEFFVSLLLKKTVRILIFWHRENPDIQAAFQKNAGRIFCSLYTCRVAVKNNYYIFGKSPD
jgi:hypothetical protein